MPLNHQIFDSRSSISNPQNVLGDNIALSVVSEWSDRNSAASTCCFQEQNAVWHLIIELLSGTDISNYPATIVLHNLGHRHRIAALRSSLRMHRRRHPQSLEGPVIELSKDNNKWKKYAGMENDDQTSPADGTEEGRSSMAVYCVEFKETSTAVYSAPLSQIYNLSINKSFIPEQWKCSTITPVAKVARPTVCAEYRPISVTPIMSRLLEKVIVKDYIYPALIHPACTHLFHDQFAFRPTGSTTAALVSLIHKISSLLVEYPYRTYTSLLLIFRKAFDTVRHSTLLAKCADLPIEDAVYNWLMSFLDNRTHCTKIYWLHNNPVWGGSMLALFRALALAR